MPTFRIVYEAQANPLFKWQVALLVCQVVIAAGSIIATVMINLWYYRRMLSNADRTHSLQATDSLVKRKQDLEQVQDAVLEVCDNAVNTAVAGTKVSRVSKAGSKSLTAVRIRLPKLRLKIKGLRYESVIASELDTLADQAEEYLNVDADEHDITRINICAAMDGTVKRIRAALDEETAALT